MCDGSQECAPRSKAFRATQAGPNPMTFPNTKLCSSGEPAPQVHASPSSRNQTPPSLSLPRPWAPAALPPGCGCRWEPPALSVLSQTLSPGHRLGTCLPPSPAPAVRCVEVGPVAFCLLPSIKEALRTEPGVSQTPEKIFSLFTFNRQLPATYSIPATHCPKFKKIFSQISTPQNYHPH